MSLFRDDTGNSLDHEVVSEVLGVVANHVDEVAVCCFRSGSGDTVVGAVASIDPDAGRDGCNGDRLLRPFRCRDANIAPLLSLGHLRIVVSRY